MLNSQNCDVFFIIYLIGTWNDFLDKNIEWNSAKSYLLKCGDSKFTVSSFPFGSFENRFVIVSRLNLFYAQASSTIFLLKGEVKWMFQFMDIFQWIMIYLALAKFSKFKLELAKHWTLGQDATLAYRILFFYRISTLYNHNKVKTLAFGIILIYKKFFGGNLSNLLDRCKKKHIQN